MTETVQGRINVQTDNGHCAITLHNPARRNAVSWLMWKALNQAIQSAEQDTSVHLISLRGYAGTFVSGADISEFETVRGTVEKAQAYEALNGRVFSALRQAKTPTIALIEGFCFGGGVGLAAACDMRIASNTAKFCIPAAKLGLAYPSDGVRDLVRLIGPGATKTLFFTADPINAETALRIGLVDELISGDDYDATVQMRIATILSRAPLTLRAAKAAIAASYEPELMPAAQDAATQCFASQDYQEGRHAFLDKRKPAFTGS